MEVLDLFSAAAGGWSLGLHRAGFRTMAACEWIDWRRAIYAENNPGVKIYDDVRTLSADRILADFGRLPDVVVGSPPCQDISPANTKGKGVEGERSGLFFEAVRIIGEIRPRWFALENSHNLRTKGADAVLAALEGLGYSCWPFVVRAGDVGANHERPRSWIVGCDLAQVADAAQERCGDAADAKEIGRLARAGNDEGSGREAPAREFADISASAGAARETPDPDQARQAHGRMESGLRQEEIADDGCGDGRGADRPGVGQMAICPDGGGGADGPWPVWSLDDLAARIRMDDGLPARVAGTRVAVGGPKGTAAASLIVEAYGDAVVPQIPEAIGRAILRVEAGLAAVMG